MPKPGPLDPAQARRTLAHRFGRRADSLRQFNTKFGARSKRVFLVWTKMADGSDERGVGNEVPYARVELLPTPRVSELTSVARFGVPEGTFSQGSVRVDEISIDRYTEDMLRGLVIPAEPGDPGRAIAPRGVERVSDPTIDFFYEIIDDGRGDNPAQPQRFQLIGYPSRLETKVQFAVFLNRSSADETRRLRPASFDDGLG